MRAVGHDVAVTGLGAVCAVGGDCRALWGAVSAGRGGIRPITRFATDAFSVHTGAEVPGWGAATHDGRERAEELCRGFAAAAAREAWHHARLDAAGVRPERIGIAFGTGLGDLVHPSNTLAEHVAEILGCRGPCITVSTACSSSTGALAVARDCIAMGAADVMIAGGADVLTPEVFAGFHALGVLSPERCAPFSYPLGTTLGEGAGFAVLERHDLACARGANITVVLTGSGLSGDAYHETSPEPRGSGVERALRLALTDAAVSPAEVDYVNAHGSGTSANDTAEWQGIQKGLGARAASVPVSSSKGALGHGQGAAGILETIVTVLAYQHGRVPPTLNFVGSRPQTPPDPVPGPAPRAHRWRHAVVLNSAFGGANAAVVLSASARRRAPRPLRPVYVYGTGIVGPWGLGREAFLGVARNGRPRRGSVPAFAIEQFVPRADPRGLDPLSRYVTAACALAVTEAGVAVRGAQRNRSGLIMGITRPSATSIAEFTRSIEERGLPGLSAAAFARIVLNAAPGFASKLLSLRGPLTTVTTGEGSGLAAILLAAEMVATRCDVDLMVAGGADEGNAACVEDEAGPADGAACLLLGTAGAMAHAPGVRVAGWGMTGPDRLPDAVAQARASDPRATMPVRTYAARDWGSGAAASALACAEAVLALRTGELDCALVTSDGGRSVCTALLLCMEEAE